MIWLLMLPPVSVIKKILSSSTPRICLSSEYVFSNGGDMLRNFHETDSVSFEQNPCGLGESAVQHQMSVRVGETKGDACGQNI